MHLSSPTGLMWAHAGADPISWAIEMKYLQSVFVFSIRRQPKQSWGAWQHSAGLISAHVMLQAQKCHLNLVPNYGSLPGPALLPLPILVHSLSCTLFVFYRNSLLVSEAKIKITKKRSATRSILAL